VTTRAVEILRAGGLVAFPTETVYGLGADATNADAVRRLFAVKGRPAGHPVIAHIGVADALAALDEWAVDVDDDARRLARACWPGPLTLVVRRRPGRIVDEVTGGRDTVGVRVPDHPLALELLRSFGGAIAAPSANRFGRVSPTTAAHVYADLGDDVDLVLDGGPCRVGVESTIVDCAHGEPAILRLGGVPAEDVERIIGRAVARRIAGEVAAPGTLPSHYAPRARVVLSTRDELAARVAALATSDARVAVLAAAPVPALPVDTTLLEMPADPGAYAEVLYASLREVDGRAIDVVVVVPPADEGLGAAVVDRLRRAAAG
jgi:L-threonylcarbamoyladenylate synthase